MKFFTIFAAIMASTSSVVLAEPSFTRCSVLDSPADLQHARLVKSPHVKRARQPGQVNVQTYVNVVTSSEKAYKYPDSKIRDQIGVLNAAYSKTPFKFTLVSVNRTINPVWAASSDGSSSRTQMQYALKKGGREMLNLYFLSDMGGGALGSCNMPSAYASTPLMDGCVLLADTLPGGTAAPFNLGKSAVHEVGHWFGLYHTFTGGCSGNGDFVSDTPAESGPAYGCPTVRDSCPGVPGLDPINNYMDFSDDSCMTEFTNGQISRMDAASLQYRGL